MIKRIIPIFLLLRNDIALVYHTLVDTSADRRVRLLIVFLILYVLVPTDIIADIIPLMGQVDDVAVALFVLHHVKSAQSKKSPPSSDKTVIDGE